MNQRAMTYLFHHGVVKFINGHPDWMLPFEKLQGFLDLLGPADIAPGCDHLQQLYQAQAEAVHSIQAQIVQHNTCPSTSPTHEDE
jgi:hypothetical protein